MRRVLTPFNLISLALLAVSAFAYYKVQESTTPPPVPVYGVEEEKKEVNVNLYFSDSQVQEFRKEQRTLSVERDSPLVVARAALQALAEGPQQDGLRVLPEGVDAPQVWVRGEHFFVNLPESYTRLNYGSSGENMLVCSITNTLLDLRGARDVTFLVNGKSVETLLGHLDLREPFRKDDCN